ncbi:MAG: hypothetical protein IH984_09420 [Planctomycetes bacterium]|nr:hypothetical protein [Planctomycetota bacterium]
MKHYQTPDITEEEAFRCIHCGYCVRGCESDMCTECGKPLIVLVGKFVNPGQFHAAAAALTDAGIEFEEQHINPPSHALNQWLGGATLFGSATIHVAKRDYERSCTIVDEIKNKPLAPIVERTDPICPNCGQQLDLDGQTICKSCNAPFCWIDINEPEIDTTGSLCKECQYDLTGNTTNFCPECNLPILLDLDALVAIATREDDQDQQSTALLTARSLRLKDSTLVTISVFAVLLSIVFVFALLMFDDSIGSTREVWHIAITAAVSLFVTLLIIKAVLSAWNDT